MKSKHNNNNYENIFEKMKDVVKICYKIYTESKHNYIIKCRNSYTKKTVILNS